MSGPGSGSGLDPEARRRVSLAVRAGEAVRDPAEAPAAVELARLAQRRLEDRTLPAALRISAGVVAVWLLLVAVPVTLSSGLHSAALAAGLGVGVLLFSVILLLGRRQLRLARRAEQRNLRLLEGGH
jgi:protein-S-isoprenylcysteine O-methyltransferase Ste14